MQKNITIVLTSTKHECDNSHMPQHTPLTTKSGLRIGSAYVPTTRPYHDRDALKLQDALLRNRPSVDASGVFIAAVCAVVIAIPLIHHWTR